MSIPLANQKVIELIMKGTCVSPGASAKTINNVFTFRRTTFTDPVVKADIQAAFQLTIGDTILAALNEDYTQTSNSVRILDDAEDVHELSVQAGVGAIAGDRLPTFASVVCPLRTNVRGRRAQGRKSFAPVTEADTLNDILTGAAVTRWQAVRDAILAGFTDANGNQWLTTVTSRVPPHTQLRVNPTTIRDAVVTSVLLNLTIGRVSQRKQKTVR